jgi:hypothetical protein
MNQDQLISLVRSLLKAVGAAFVSHGATKAGSLLNAEDTVGLALAIVGFVWSHLRHGDSSQAPKPSDSPSTGGAAKIGLFLAISLAFLSSGCAWFSGKTAQLEVGGAYAPLDVSAHTNEAGQVEIVTNAVRAPDFAFFAADSAFDLAESAVQGVFKFELTNRVWLWSVSPQIKHSLDKIRPAVWDAIGKYTTARAAYVANPTPEGLATIQGIAQQLKTIADMAQAVIAQPKPVTQIGLQPTQSAVNINK